MELRVQAQITFSLEDVNYLSFTYVVPWHSVLYQDVILNTFHFLYFIMTCKSLYNPLGKIVCSSNSHQVFEIFPPTIKDMLLLWKGDFMISLERTVVSFKCFLLEISKQGFLQHHLGKSDPMHKMKFPLHPSLFFHRFEEVISIASILLGCDDESTMDETILVLLILIFPLDVLSLIMRNHFEFLASLIQLNNWLDSLIWTTSNTNHISYNYWFILNYIFSYTYHYISLTLTINPSP